MCVASRSVQRIESVYFVYLESVVSGIPSNRMVKGGLMQWLKLSLKTHSNWRAERSRAETACVRLSNCSVGRI